MLKIMLGFILALLMTLPVLADIDPEAMNDAITSSNQTATLKVANRPIMVFRANLLGEPPDVRASRAREVINELLSDSSDLPVTFKPLEDSYVLLLGGRRAFIVTPKDIDPLLHESVGEAAKMAADNLRQVVAETSESRNLHLMLTAAGYSAAATLLFLLLVRLVVVSCRRMAKLLLDLMHRKSEALKLGDTQVVELQQLSPVLSRILNVLQWGLILLMANEWLGFVLSRFPYTRPWGESINLYLWEVAHYLFNSMLGALPGLGIAVAIFFLARAFSGFSKRMLTRLASAHGAVSWLNSETLSPTTRLTSISIWLFSLAMAYPYLPGAGTDAFKGLSVLVGLMVSLGASSVIGQAASGLILTYTRTLRPGEYVRIGEHEGTVTEMGMFTTRIRTGLGEVLTIPNAMITSTVTKNYSRAAQGVGYVVDAMVTIGYDVPWRQVEALLLEAARRTEGIVSEPAPNVFQMALTDFYPEYRLVAQATASEPRPRAMLLSTLNAHIQDVFNEYGIQIMSPHYVADPQQAKVVPREQWYSAPASQNGKN